MKIPEILKDMERVASDGLPVSPELLQTYVNQLRIANNLSLADVSAAAHEMDDLLGVPLFTCRGASGGGVTFQLTNWNGDCALQVVAAMLEPAITAAQKVDEYQRGYDEGYIVGKDEK